MEQFRIDSEFQNKIPPIGEDEFKQLRENILAAGEVYEPLVVWNGVLVDGHNRWKVIRENPSIKYKVREMSFPDKWAAFEWMYKNQLGRRNLTDEQRAYTIGKMYEARKKSVGAPIANANARKQLPQSGAIDSEPKDYGTAAAIAREIGVGRNTVDRAGKFAKGIDTLRDVSPDAADKVLSGNAKVTRTAVAGLAKLDRDEVEQAADAIMAGMLIPTRKPSGSETHQEEHHYVYGIDGLIEDIQVNGEKYVAMLERTLDVRQFILDMDGARGRVADTINNIIDEIVKVRERLCEC